MTEALVALVVIEALAVVALTAAVNDAIAQRDKARRQFKHLLDVLAKKMDGVNYTEGTGHLTGG